MPVQAWKPVPQQVVDRIVVRIEDDVITLSEVRELGRFQQLVEGRAASEEELTRQLIEQWIVTAEAHAARFAAPSEAEVTREVEKLARQFASPEFFLERLRALELTPGAVRRLVERQLYLLRYLDYKFRPAIQVEEAQVARYYGEELAPRLQARGEAVPPLERVAEQIRELLLQREVSARAGRWLEETRGRVRVELNPGEKR